MAGRTPSQVRGLEAPTKFHSVAVAVIPDFSVEAAANVIPPSLYTVDATYDVGAFNAETFLNPPNPTASIFLPPDIRPSRSL
jgi:hypothetical protein